MSFATTWTQFFPPRDGATLKEANLPSQVGKVFIVTGGSSGIGYELSRILYGAGGKVYVLTRSKELAEEAIDFPTLRTAAQQFLDREGPDGRLDVLFNNAGTGALKDAPRTVQGHEHHFAINSVGHHLLTRLLTPVLARTAKRSPADSVRVVWAASVLVEMNSPQGGVRKEYMRDPFGTKDEVELYSSSKAANWFLASEFARRQSADPDAGLFGSGVVHLAGNPGNHSTRIWRKQPAWLMFFINPFLRDPVHGAETLPTDSFFLQWHPGQRADLISALKPEEEGGSGRAREYFEWCEEMIKEFVD
ncbi:NAD(P)-binding protein [Hypoxylon sp. FL1150]|nr:NAD(P)-binding protein [Hypoxylon sp. FL1150]